MRLSNNTAKNTIFYKTITFRTHWNTDNSSTQFRVKSNSNQPTNELEIKVSKGAKIRIRYNPVSHLTQDTNGKVTNSQLDTTNENQEASPPPPQQATTKHTQTDAHKDTANTRQNKNTKDTQKKHRPGTASKTSYWRAQTGPTAQTSPPTQIKTNSYPTRTKDPQPTNTSSPRTYKSRYNKETKQSQGPNSKQNRTPQQKKPNRKTLAGPTNSQSTRPPLSHQQASPQVGTIIESEVRPIGVQPKRKAKPPTVIGLTTKHAVRRNISMLQPILL